MAATTTSSRSNTFFTNPVKGSGVRGIELDRCYEGEYVNGKRHGYGRYIYPNSFFIYEGNWANGEKHGLGRFLMGDGGYYEGEFVQGEIQGQGTRVFANGNVYVGTFALGEMHGFGVMTFGNGDVYQGPVHHNSFEGEGVYTFARTGDRYQGDFRHHCMTGQGTMQYSNGDKYVGEWVDGKRSGVGFCTFHNGDTYQGAWKDDMFHGEGVWTVARYGISYSGLFEGGRPTTIPQRINVLYDYEEDPKKAKKPSAAAAGKAGEVDLPPVLPVVIGEPLSTAVTIAAQFEEALPPPLPEQSALSTSGPAPGKAGQGKKALPPAHPAGPITVYTEPASAGHAYRTAHMESGRVVNLTLHREPPCALPEDQAMRVLVCTVEQPGEPSSRDADEDASADGDGNGHSSGSNSSVRVRLLFMFTHVDTPMTVAHVDGQPVTTLQVSMSAGQCVLHGLVVGRAEDTDKLSVPGGIGYLVASSWGVSRGYCRVTLPELKAVKKPGGGK